MTKIVSWYENPQQVEFDSPTADELGGATKFSIDIYELNKQGYYYLDSPVLDTKFADVK